MKYLLLQTKAASLLPISSQEVTSLQPTETKPEEEDWDVDVSKNRGTPKWMVYNGKPY